jgi:putative tryptophan/tyrosine transport system substrate-binding protein
MQRRQFLASFGAASAWPFLANAQQLPVVGFLSGRSVASDAHLVQAFRDGLSEATYADGRNVTIEFRWAEGNLQRLDALAAELVARKPAVIFAGAVDARIRALNKQLSAFPVVFATGGDPVSLGLAASLARPGGHATGATVISATLWPKRLELLRDLIGQTGVVAVLVNPNNATTDPATKSIEAAAKNVGQRIILVNATAEKDFEAAFAKIADERANGLIVADDAIFQNGREKLVDLARRQAIPAIYGRREFPSSDGLMSYGASTPDQYRQSGLYVGRILAGAKPGELPFLQPTKFETVINLKTAKALGITVPKILLTFADEVIE